jgi:hypothetical protein
MKRVVHSRGLCSWIEKPDAPRDKKRLAVRYYGLLPEIDLEDVMAITVEDFDVTEVSEGSSSESKNNEQAREFVSNLPDATRSRLHITMDTLRESIKPVEAKSMVEHWRRGKEPDIIKSIKLVDQVVYGRIKGLVT